MATITKPILLDETGQRIAEALESIDGKTRPVKTSELENDSDFQNTEGVQEIVEDYGFVTRLVSDLANYYLKGETYTQSEVNALIASISQFRYVVVTVLPTPAASTMNKIYLVPSSSAAAQNVKDEFITIDNGEGSDTRYTWEQIGSTTIDLSDYYTKSETDAAIAQETTRATTAEESLADGKLDKAIPITHDALVALRDNGELVPGQQYRITDYYNSLRERSFDVIVTADSEHSLNENARATVNERGEAYFRHSDLTAWELKYCIDNDEDRFQWAFMSGYNGVIYYMKDEWGNEAPFDFKHIMFHRFLPTLGDVSVYLFTAFNDDGEMVEASHAFNDGQTTDEDGYTYGVKGNIIEPRFDVNEGVFLLPDVVFTSYPAEAGDFKGFNGNVVRRDSNVVTLRNGCHDNVIGAGCERVTLAAGECGLQVEAGMKDAELTGIPANSWVGKRNGTLIVRDIFEEQEYLTNAEIDAMFNTEDDS